MKYIKFNNKIIKYHDNITDLNVSDFKIKEAYKLDDDEIYIYAGLDYNNNLARNSSEENHYFTINGNGDYLIYGTKITDYEITEQENIRLENLLSNIKDFKQKEEKSNPKPIKKKKESSNVKRRKKGARINRDQILKMEIYDEDDPMVRLVKETINNSSITMGDIYKAVDTESNGYNLFYGLSTRYNMSWKTFELWCEILQVEPQLTIKDIM